MQHWLPINFFNSAFRLGNWFLSNGIGCWRTRIATTHCFVLYWTNEKSFGTMASLVCFTSLFYGRQSKDRWRIRNFNTPTLLTTTQVVLLVSEKGWRCTCPTGKNWRPCQKPKLCALTYPAWENKTMRCLRSWWMNRTGPWHALYC